MYEAPMSPSTNVGQLFLTSRRRPFAAPEHDAVQGPKVWSRAMVVPRSAGQVGAVWGVLGVLAILLHAVSRLVPVAIDALAMPLSNLHHLGVLASLVLIGYSEGYRGFQRQFSPRVIARARYLAEHPSLARVAFAPLFCMGFFHATRRRLLTSWLVAFGIVCLVIAIRWAPQPWRGIVDLGVVVGLGWGAAAIAGFASSALAGRPLPVAADVPVRTPGAA